MYGSRAVTLLVLISDDVINWILKLDIQTNILVYVTKCCTDLTSKVLKERTFGQPSAVLIYVQGTLVLQLLEPPLAYILWHYIRSLDTSVATSRAAIGVYSVGLYTFMGHQCCNFSSRHWRIFCRPIYVHGTLVFQLLEPSLMYIL